MNDQLRILSLRVESFKKISVLAIDPVSLEPIVLTGDNEAGKSSVLDSISFAFTGKGVETPVHEGDEGGKIIVDIGGEEREFEIARSFNVKGNKYLQITDAEGRKVPRAQEFLNTMLGALAFDPEEFVRMKDKERADAIRIAAGLDFADLDSQRKIAFEERRVANRRLKDVESEKKSLGPVGPNPGEEKVATEIVEKMDYCRMTISGNESTKEAHEVALKRAQELQKQIKELEEELAGVKAEIDSQRNHFDQTAKTVESAREQFPKLEEELAGLQEHNEKVSTYKADQQRRESVNSRWEEATLEAKAQDDLIKQIDEEKERKIKESHLPEGIQFTDDGSVLFEGRPFSDLNTAKQWKISTQLAILQNPRLAVVFVREGALMNTKTREFLFDWAKEKGVQIWMEHFTEEPAEEGIFIEEGRITHIDGEPVTK